MLELRLPPILFPRPRSLLAAYPALHSRNREGPRARPYSRDKPAVDVRRSESTKSRCTEAARGRKRCATSAAPRGR